MKIFVLLLLLFFSLSVFARQRNYRSLEQCGGDTLAYVKYNFETNKARYIGKSMKFLLDEIDIQLMTNCFYTSDSGPYVTEDRQEKINGVYFCYLQAYECRNYDSAKKLYYTVHVLFQVPPYTHNDKEYWALAARYEDDYCWDDEFYNLFKDYVIKKINLFVSNAKK